MARYELNDVEGAVIGSEGASADVFFRLGMMYATGRSVSPDLVAAHKWFNVAALRGNREAARYRTEIADEMSRDELSAALAAARAYLSAA